MPIYEFYCPSNNKVYSFFSHSVIDQETVPRCPDDPKLPMQRSLSRFAVIGKAKEPSEGDEGGDLDDPRMEAAMAELEKEMAGMDEENPDPRQMGHLMRRMSELTGEKLPGAMEEMVGRLEAGEDPDKLEEEYGDLADLYDFGGEGEDGAPAGETRKSLLRRLRTPRHDPQLYELRDYI